MLLLLAIAYFGGSEYIKRAQDINDFAATKPEVNIDKKTKVASFLHGLVTHVSDGDTMILKDSVGDTHKIRLNGIDAPEMGQEFGNESKAFLERLVLNKSVTVEVVGVDQYRRILGVVAFGSKDVNKAMLENGMAWQYKYNKDEVYASLVRNARNKRLNIWSNPDALDPHAWRKKHKK